MYSEKKYVVKNGKDNVKTGINFSHIPVTNINMIK